MEQPKKWSKDLANALVFYAGVNIGWAIFQERSKNSPAVVDDLIKFIRIKPSYEYFKKAFGEEVKNETPISLIGKDISYQLLEFFFIKIRYGKEKMDTTDLVGAWEQYLEILKYDYKMYEHDKKEGVPESQRWHPRQTINVYKKRFELLEVTDDHSLIDYFVHLSEEFLKQLRMLKET